MAIYTLGVGLQKLSAGDLRGYRYVLLVTTEAHMPSLSRDYEMTGRGMPSGNIKTPLPAGTLRPPAGQIIMSVGLPTKSQVHFAGFSLKDDVFKTLLGNTSLDNQMNQVQLEGNFPDIFRLYCDKGKEIELLEVLDPPRMAFLIDFCEHFNWELFENNLYFVQAEASNKPSNMNMVQAAEEFAQRILPTLQRMSAYK